MSIPTKEIKTAAGVVFVLNEYITYGQHRDISKIYLDEKTSDWEKSDQADRMGFGFVVVSIDGDTKDLYEKLRGMAFTDVQPVVEEVKKILSPKKD